MKKLTLLVAMLAIAACLKPYGWKPNVEKPDSLTETTFQRSEAGGEQSFTVRVRATKKVSPAMLEVLGSSLTIRRVEKHRPEEIAFWTDTPMALDPERAEVQVELLPANPQKDPKEWIWTWPDLFQISRPGVLELRPESGGEELTLRSDAPEKEDIGVRPQALHSGGAHTLRGRLMCAGAGAPFLQVVAGGIGGFTDATGHFNITGEFPGIPETVFIGFEGQIPLGAAGATTARLQIFDDFHFTRTERVDQTPATMGDTSDFGGISIPGNDCTLWQWGINALTHYFTTVGATPPAGELRIKRWSAVFIAAGAAPHTFYDYIVAPTDFVTARTDRTLFHEFGHSIRHVADGARTHWDWDDVRFIYGRAHDGGQVTNKAFAFNEGWGTYWASVVKKINVPVHPAAPTDPSFMDFNEDRVAERLMKLSGPVGHKFMVEVLLNNPGVIHTLQQFEERYCAAVGSANNAFCSGGLPIRAVPSCPAGYSDDGLTCRLVNVISKPSFGRSVGSVPDSCGAGLENNAGLCYPRCPTGFYGVGPVCWQTCPPGYHDDGATCRRDALIFGADNNACPWYDKCGLTFARGCSVCPPGFANDGCTCRRNVHIFGKATRTRGAGTIPNGCRAGLVYDAGLCYPACPAGFNGVGPVCWGACPVGFADHGATCYRDPNIFSDDPVIPP